MDRKDFLKTISLIMSTPIVSSAQPLLDELKKAEYTQKMPAFFIGHGNPMNAIYDNAFTKKLNTIRNTISKPKAILVISAHWITKGTYVSTNPHPKTIYDFGGFPDKLFRVKYEPSGAPELAKEIKQKVNYTSVSEDDKMGLDHGAWTILKHIYPSADIPVFQLSIDYSKPAAYHYELAKQLNYLRYKGVVIIGSGNIVHNLGMVDFNNPNSAYDWAIEFDSTVKKLLDKGDDTALINYEKLGKSALLSIPTNDHYLPMLYILGLRDKGEQVSYIYESMEMGSLSMRSFVIN